MFVIVVAQNRFQHHTHLKLLELFACSRKLLERSQCRTVEVSLSMLQMLVLPNCDRGILRALAQIACKSGGLSHGQKPIDKTASCWKRLYDVFRNVIYWLAGMIPSQHRLFQPCSVTASVLVNSHVMFPGSTLSCGVTQPRV